MSLAGEAAVLDELEPRWRERGYTVVRTPAAGDVPAFLRGFRPDAIATGRTPSLVIEVVDPSERTGERRLEDLRRLFDGQTDWQLEIVYAPSGDPAFTQVSPETIEDTLQSARALVEGHPRAALLLAWAVLEAVVRTYVPDSPHRGLSPGAIHAALLEAGHISQTEGARLLAIAHNRNAVAHGQLDLDLSPDTIRELIDLSGRLLAAG